MQTASYNNLNQLTDLSGQTLSYDLNGNLLSDGQRTYSWDAENKLVSIGYPGQPGKLTTFSYDGLGRRTAIASTPAGGGGAVTTSYIWCGARICQARNAGNSVTREYFAEGEFVPGSPPQTYYYGPDQIGSARRVFASAASAPAYAYDPYGNALQGTAPTTDFNYAGMFYNADSGLYLTQYRVYDPVAGRWLSRDPVGETNDSIVSLYRYASSNPISETDPTGLLTLQIGFGGDFFGGQAGFGFAFDTQGNVDVYGYLGPAAAIGAATDFGLSIQASNAPTICELRGPFFNVSGRGGSAIGGSVDYFYGKSGNLAIYGGGVTIGAGAGGSVSGGYTYTWLFYH